MKRHLPEEYKRRSIVETVHSVLKRKIGSFVRSRIPEVAEKRDYVKDNSVQYKENNSHK